MEIGDDGGLSEEGRMLGKGVRELRSDETARRGRGGRPRRRGWDELDAERSGLDDVGLEKVADGWELDEVMKETGALETEGTTSYPEPGRT